MEDKYIWLLILTLSQMGLLGWRVVDKLISKKNSNNPGHGERIRALEKDMENVKDDIKEIKDELKERE